MTPLRPDNSQRIVGAVFGDREVRKFAALHHGFDRDNQAQDNNALPRSVARLMFLVERCVQIVSVDEYMRGARTIYLRYVGVFHKCWPLRLPHVLLPFVAMLIATKVSHFSSAHKCGACLSQSCDWRKHVSVFRRNLAEVQP